MTAQILMDIGQTLRAINHCEQAIKLQPELGYLQQTLGRAQRNLGELIAARASIKRAIDLDPTNIDEYEVDLKEIEEIMQRMEPMEAQRWMVEGTELYKTVVTKEKMPDCKQTSTF